MPRNRVKPLKEMLPCKECGGQCCKYAPIHLKEWETIKAKFNIGDDVIIEECFQGTKAHAVVVSKPGTDRECYFLKDGRCSIYTYRPNTCRKVAEDGVCAYTNPKELQRRVQAIAERGHVFLSQKWR